VRADAVPSRVNRNWRPALAASIALHLAVLLALTRVELQPAAPPSRAAALELRVFVAPVAVPVAAELPLPEFKAAEQAPERTEAAQDEAAPPREDPAAEPERPQSVESPAGTAPDAPAPEPLQARLLQQLRQRTVPEIPAAPSGAARLQGRAVPRLPAERGWLSAYAGTVAPEVDSWRELDGSQRAQVTLTDGTVVCLQRRAPTIEEMMQPWKSNLVTMGRLCGKARPAPVDYSDPRVRPPPRTAGGD